MRDARFHRTAMTAALLLLFGGVGCSEAVDGQPANQFKEAPDWTDSRPESQQGLEPQPLNDEVFVDAQRVQELATRDENPATVIDVRDRSTYEEGHFPGAHHSGHDGDYKPFKDPEYNDILPREVKTLQEEARAMGIDDDRPVIVYGAENSSVVGRVHWAIEYLGHGEARLYNGGYENLIDETGVEPETEVNDEKGDFVVRRRDSVRATNEQVRRAAEGELDAVLIDTRRESEFTGEEVRAPRHGYIPNADYYYWKNVFDEQGDLRSKSEIEQEFEENGLLKEDATLIPYCQTGTRSGFVYSVLRWVGADNAQNYDGSWARWARLNEVDVAQDGEERLEN